MVQALTIERCMEPIVGGDAGSHNGGEDADLGDTVNEEVVDSLLWAQESLFSTGDGDQCEYEHNRQVPQCIEFAKIDISGVDHNVGNKGGDNGRILA